MSTFLQPGGLHRMGREGASVTQVWPGRTATLPSSHVLPPHPAPQGRRDGSELLGEATPLPRGMAGTRGGVGVFRAQTEARDARGPTLMGSHQLVALESLPGPATYRSLTRRTQLP